MEALWQERKPAAEETGMARKGNDDATEARLGTRCMFCLTICAGAREIR